MWKAAIREPSKAPAVCTHTLKIAEDKAKREVCKAKTDFTSCMAFPDSEKQHLLLTVERKTWDHYYEYAISAGYKVPTKAEAKALIATTGALVKGSEKWVIIGDP